MTQLSSSLNHAQLIVEIVGNWGRWQLKCFIANSLFSVIVAWHVLQFMFLAPNVKHWCVDKIETTFLNEITVNQCVLNDESPCTKWKYNVGQNDSFYHSTIISEWDLVCNRKWLVSFSQSVYMFGGLLADGFMSQCSDRIGRKPTILIGWATSMVDTISAIFSVNIIQFILSRSLIAFGMKACYSTAFVLMLEIVGPKYREMLGLAVSFGWAVGYVSLPGIVWIVRDFRYLLMICAATQLLLIVLYNSIYESPRWLLANGRLNEAVCELQNAVKVNRKNNNEKIDAKIAMLKNEIDICASNDERSINVKYSFVDLFKTWTMTRMTLLVYFIWFANSVVYYGLSFNTNSLVGDPFVNFSLMGIIEIPGYIAAIYFVKWFGNRKVLLAMLIGAAIGCWGSILIEYNYYLGIVFAMAGKFCVTISYAVIYVYTVQLFPTVIRTIGLGSSAVVARIGSIIVPYIQDITQVSGLAFSMILIGLVAFVAALMVVPLKESHGTNMPDKPEDVEHSIQ